MIFRTVLLAVLCATPAAPVFAKDTALAPGALWLRVGADGKPADVSCAPGTSADLCPLLTRAVSRWVFTPGRRDGAPAAVDITLGLPLSATPQADGKGFTIHATGAFVSLRRPAPATGGVSLQSRTMNPPRYPTEEQRRGREARVVVEISRSPGSTRPKIEQVWLNGGRAPEVNLFVKAARVAVAQWELVPWPPERLTECVAIDFTINTAPTQAAGVQSPDTRPCESKYIDGFTLPVLVTDPLTATF